ncbi:MAG: heparinase II/III-family protein, partial [Gemmatimonadetes bacterium]|nr:heparinase II/III-family protein [Gemmatimonadota bacterium]
ALHGNPMGFLTAGHSHASLMAVELSLAGRPVLVDPGTYRYVAEARTEYRAFSRHNVLDIEGVDPPHPVGPFKWSFPDGPWIAELEPIDGGVRATRLVGSGATGDQVRHERCIRLLNTRSAWVEDRVSSGRPRRLQYSLHLPPGSLLAQPEPAVIAFELESGGTLRLRVEDLESDDGWESWTVEREWYWMSRRYGQRERAPCLRLRRPGAARISTRIRVDVTCP